MNRTFVKARFELVFAFKMNLSHENCICSIFSHTMKKRDAKHEKKKINTRPQFHIQVWLMETSSQRSLSSLEWQWNILTWQEIITDDVFGPFNELCM